MSLTDPVILDLVVKYARHQFAANKRAEEHGPLDEAVLLDRVHASFVARELREEYDLDVDELIWIVDESHLVFASATTKE